MDSHFVQEESSQLIGSYESWDLGLPILQDTPTHQSNATNGAYSSSYENDPELFRSSMPFVFPQCYASQLDFSPGGFVGVSYSGPPQLEQSMWSDLSQPSPLSMGTSLARDYQWNQYQETEVQALQRSSLGSAPYTPALNAALETFTVSPPTLRHFSGSWLSSPGISDQQYSATGGPDEEYLPAHPDLASPSHDNSLVYQPTVSLFEPDFPFVKTPSAVPTSLHAQFPACGSVKEKTGTFICPQCPHRALRRCDLKKHIKRRHDAPQYQCPHCSKRFHWPKDVRRHVDSRHAEPCEALDPRTYRVRRDQPFFKVGTVFMILWSEPGSDLHGSSNIRVGSYGERSCSKVRRFVVVRDGEALPLKSYTSDSRHHKGTATASRATVTPYQNAILQLESQDSWNELEDSEKERLKRQLRRFFLRLQCQALRQRITRDAERLRWSTDQLTEFTTFNSISEDAMLAVLDPGIGFAEAHTPHTTLVFEPAYSLSCWPVPSLVLLNYVWPLLLVSESLFLILFGSAWACMCISQVLSDSYCNVDFSMKTRLDRIGAHPPRVLSFGTRSLRCHVALSSLELLQRRLWRMSCWPVSP